MDDQRWTVKDTTELISDLHAYLTAHTTARIMKGGEVKWREVAAAMVAIGMSCADTAKQMGEPGTGASLIASYLVEACGRSRELAHAIVDDCFDRADRVHAKPKKFS